MSEADPLGIVIGGARPESFSMIASRNIRVGEYVTVEAEEGALLGLVDSSSVANRLLGEGDVKSFQSALERRTSEAWRSSRSKAYYASVRVLGLLAELERGVVRMPSLASEPGAEVMAAGPDVLRPIFSGSGPRWAEVGSLLREPEVRVSVDLNKVASRHLAILAATGSGKSNLLALLAKRVAAARGTMVIFDYQGEYSSLRLDRVSHVRAKLNPRLLDPERFADLLDVRENADVQRSVLASAMTDDVMKASDFWGKLLEALNGIADGEDGDEGGHRKGKRGDSRERRHAVARLIDIIDRARRRMGGAMDPGIGDPLDQLRPNYVNVVDMLELSERQAATVMGYFMEEILEDRKRARRYSLGGDAKGEGARFPSPVILAVEEAHTFLPADRETDATYIASKIAREGRKFGVSLVVVSQRPSRLHQDVLSQMGSMAVMRISQPKDKNYILESSELATEELADYLPSLNVGEAVLLGQWVALPSLVKVDAVEEKVMGMDIDAVGEWASSGGSSLEDTDELMTGRW